MVAFTVAVSILSVLVSLGLGRLLPGLEVIGLLGGLGFVAGIAIGVPLAWRSPSCGMACTTLTG